MTPSGIRKVTSCVTSLCGICEKVDVYSCPFEMSDQLPNRCVIRDQHRRQSSEINSCFDCGRDSQP